MYSLIVDYIYLNWNFGNGIGYSLIRFKIANVFYTFLIMLSCGYYFLARRAASGSGGTVISGGSTYPTQGYTCVVYLFMLSEILL